MPVNLSIKHVPDEQVERLRARARRNHRSLQGELMAIIQAVAEAEQSGPSAVQEAAPPWGAPHARSLDVGRERLVAGPGESTIIIRQTRDAREFRIEDLQEYLEKLPFETPAESATWLRRDRDRK